MYILKLNGIIFNQHNKKCEKVGWYKNLTLCKIYSIQVDNNKLGHNSWNFNR